MFISKHYVMMTLYSIAPIVFPVHLSFFSFMYTVSQKTSPMFLAIT